MKIKLKIILIIITIVLLSNLAAYAGMDPPVHIPDANFKAYLVDNFDDDSDGEIQLSEALTVTSMDASSQNIADLTGIESFTNLTELNCCDNQLTNLDVSTNTSLSNLYYMGNQITHLDTSGCTSLESLNISESLTHLNASGCTSLTNLLSMDGDPLEYLDASGCTSLIDLHCSSNQLTYLDISSCTSLAELYCNNNHLTSLDISANTSLSGLYCHVNSLTNLDVSKNTSLTQLYCYYNQLSSLNVSTNTSLIGLDCSLNSLTSLNVVANINLSYLYCNNNRLTNLDVSSNTGLTQLLCYFNDLTSLNVSANTSLTMLRCNNNQLTNLNVSANTSLSYLYCSINKMTNIPDVTSCSSLQTFSCAYNYFDTDDCPAILAIEAMAIPSFDYNPQHDGGNLDCSCTDLFYRDADGDGYGDSSDSQTACSAPDGYVADNTDADDTDPSIYPGATEYCDGKDNDQDGEIDEECVLLEPLPDTGQTLCYVIPTATLDCCPAPGEDFHGQDAQYQRARSYTKLDPNGSDLPDSAVEWDMVRDNVTGLIWEVKQASDASEDYSNPRDADNTYTWYDSNPATNGGDAGTQGDGTNTFDTEDFINALNTANYGGYDDWRMPTYRELSRLVDSSHIEPAITTDFFPNVATTGDIRYFTSTTVRSNISSVVEILFGSGAVARVSKSGLRNVRAVRSGSSQSLPLAPLVDNDDGTVSDPNTGLMWQQAEPGLMAWQNALYYCENLVLPSAGGYDDWRLPDLKELQSLADYSLDSPFLDINCFPGVSESHYWSSTSKAFYASYHWAVSFSYINVNDTYTDRNVRAVRTIQEASGNADISVTPSSLDFDDVCIGSSVQQYIEISNNGDADLMLETLSFSGAGASHFTIGDCCAHTIVRPGASARAGIIFTPTATETVNAVLEITSNDAGGPTNIPLSGSGLFISLNEALDNNALTFTTGSDLEDLKWYGENLSWLHGGSAAQCGEIDEYNGSWIETTVTGPTGLSFYWRVSCEEHVGMTGDYLGLRIDNNLVSEISGDVDWTLKNVDISDGDHTVKWEFVRGTKTDHNRDEAAGWLDQVCCSTCLSTFYADSDGDGYGDAAVSQTSCAQPAGYVTDNTDADDTDAGIHPGATEYCDGKDNDQDDEIDEECVLIEPLPDTGQTRCYNNTEPLVSCPVSGEAFYGQDAQYTRERSYTKLDSAGNDLDVSAGSWAMVRDNVTGLIWEVKQAGNGTGNYSNPHDADNTYSWYDSNPATNGGDTGRQGDGTDTEDFINALNTENYGGYNDWRLPAIKELSRITDLNQTLPSPSTATDFFPLTTLSYYWSSTTYSSNNSLNAWSVYFGSGKNYINSKDSSFSVRAVRSDHTRSLIPLVFNVDGTVTDSNTGLMWRQNEDETMEWQNALQYCEELVFPIVDGYDDWRLPDFYELLSLADFNNPNNLNTSCWSSTTHANDSEYAWAINFAICSLDVEYKSNRTYGLNVFVVRTIQSESMGNPDISVTPLSFAFGEVEIATNAELNLSITNDGDADLVISSIPISGTDAALFSLSGDSCAGQTITPGNNCQMTVTFSPDSVGSKAAVLTINSNDPDEAQVQVPLTGTGLSSCTNFYYLDSDADGYGDPSNSVQACSAPTGYVTDNTDCNDNDPLEHPGQTWYKDADGDGYSDGTTNTTSCTRPTGYFVAAELTATSGDCNDSIAAINPGATEICGDGVDNNCNGEIDEGCCVETTFYRDIDGDGYGDANNSTESCTTPAGYVTDNTDCNDNDPLEHPGQTWYKDADNDGYSDGTTNTASCTRPTGYFVAAELTATSGDCNDSIAAINPGATEICGDGVDNNCNGEIDEGCCAEITFYRDLDGDGYGDAAVSLQACTEPAGYVGNSSDCNDCDLNEFPGQIWYQDADGDGYSSGTMVVDSCVRPDGFYVAGELAGTYGDSVDDDNSIYPGAPELYDGIDNNLNGTIDEECSSAGAVKLPDSGQNLYFNNWGPIATPAHGEPFFGQDAQYYHHRSYTKLGINGLELPDAASSWLMVRDNISGLIWEVKHNRNDAENFDNPNDADNRYTWYDSNPDTNGDKPGSPRETTDTEDFIKALNLSFYGGFNNWRLPTISELSGLINRGLNSPAIDLEFFDPTKPSPYWSATPYSYSDENRAWHIYFGYGYVGSGLTSAKCYVRAVR